MFQSVKKLFASTPTSNVPATKTRLHVEGLEDRKLMTAGITLGADGVIRIEGYDDATRGEVVSVRTLTNNTLGVYDDKIQVTMSQGRNMTSQTFDLWKITGRRQYTPAVTSVSYIGLAGNDRFTNASAINATADGGAGDDVLKGGLRNEVLIGGIGNDTLTGGFGYDWLYGGEGTDTLVDSNGVGFVLTDTGISWGGGSTDGLNSIEIADLTGGDGADVMNGKNFSGKLTLHGGAGNDSLHGGTGANFLYGDDGDDDIRGSEGIDKLYGGTGNDYLDGKGGDDLLHGDDGDDTIWAGEGADLIYGGKGSDTLRGQGGNDEFFAGKGKDYLYGGDGDDFLDGGYDRKVDHLYGEGGVDTFHQHVWADMDSYFVWEWDYYKDKIHDKEPGEQVYQVQN
jgi:Ca2+-binding RTX toxin-like protein